MAGCHGLVRGRQTAISTAEHQQLLTKVYSPEAAGVQVRVHEASHSIRWREMARPEHAVSVPLLPPDSPGSAQPIIEMRINGGSPVRMVVDTGAPVTLVDTTTALKNKLMVIDPERMQNVYLGLAGDEQTFYGMARSVTVGPELAFRNVLMAIRLQKYTQTIGGIIPVAQWDGNSLGMSTLGNFAYLTLDYTNRLATFSYRDFFVAPTDSNAHSVPFLLESKQMRVPVRFGGQTTLQAILDTGNDAPLMISSNLAKELGWQTLVDQGTPARYVGLGGELELRSFNVPLVQVAGLSFTNVPAVCGPEQFGLMIGSHLLHHFRVTFDFRRKLLWLEPPALVQASMETANK